MRPLSLQRIGGNNRMRILSVVTTVTVALGLMGARCALADSLLGS